MFLLNPVLLNPVVQTTKVSASRQSNLHESGTINDAAGMTGSNSQPTELTIEDTSHEKQLQVPADKQLESTPSSVVDTNFHLCALIAMDLIRAAALSA
eukprot:SAG31_NODE_2586_length_5430_cov_2.815044_8_plen_98_part_00